MIPALRAVGGIAFACALGLLAHRVAAPLPPAPPAAAPSLSQPAPRPLASSAPSAEAAVSPRLQLVRRCLRLAETDPLAAMELAVAQKLTDDDPGLLNALILRWAERDFSGALDWTRSQPRDAGRDAILAHLAFMRAQTEPLDAARLVVSDISPGSARDEAIVSVVHQWALRDPEAAGLWAGSLFDEALRRRAVAEVAGLAASPR